MATSKKAEIIQAPSTLKAKVGGYYIDSDILTRAEKAINGLKQEFSAWLESDILHLTEAAKTFAAERNATTANALFRAAHDLRGQAATYEFPLIARMAASLAKLVEKFTALDTLPMSLVIAHVEAIQVIHREKIKDSANLMAITLTEELEGRVMRTLARAG